MTTLAIAAGGGGDALGVLLAASLIPSLADPPLIATLAWERLRLDPVPGPRGWDGFTDLGLVAGSPVEVLPRSHPVDASAWSSLPRLVEETGARVMLLDARAGAQGIATQICQIGEAFAVDHLTVLDVGGDAIARGDEAGLRSPLADALIIAGADGSGIPADLVVVGPGLDAELSEQEVIDRLNSVGADDLGKVSPPAAEVISALGWHPSEASALLATAALGIRGTVDMRRGDRLVPLTERSPRAWRCGLRAAASTSSYAVAVAASTTLDAAERASKPVGPTELAFERSKASAAPALAPLPTATIATRVTRYARDARQRGADFVTTRRLAEAIDLPARQTTQLTEILDHHVTAQVGALWDLAALLTTEKGDSVTR